MAQTESARPHYPPPEDPNHGAYYGHPQHSPQRPPARDERSQYPSSEPRQGQYPPPDPRAQVPYPPPGQWAGQQHSAYPPPHHYPVRTSPAKSLSHVLTAVQDPQHAAYPYPPRQDMSQPPQPMQPDAYRLPPPYPPPHYAYPNYHPPAPPAPAPRQRTAIACKYCRKRKARLHYHEGQVDNANRSSDPLLRL